MKLEKSIDNKYAIYWITEDIVYFKYSDNVVIGIEDVENMLNLQFELGVDGTKKRIIHAGQFTTITSKARKHIERHKPPAKAEAFVLTGLAQRILFNVYCKSRSKVTPLRAFKDINSAVAWLNSI